MALRFWRIMFPRRRNRAGRGLPGSRMRHGRYFGQRSCGHVAKRTDRHGGGPRGSGILGDAAGTYGRSRPPPPRRCCRMMPRPEAPAPLSRRGPRPLLLHLSLAWLKSSSLTAASLNWSSVWPSSLPETEAAPPLHDALAQTLAADRALIAGIAAYRADPYTRQMADPPCRVGGGRIPAAGLWRRGAGRAVRAQPDQPRLYSRPDGRRLDAALAERAWACIPICWIGAGRARRSGRFRSPTTSPGGWSGRSRRCREKSCWPAIAWAGCWRWRRRCACRRKSAPWRCWRPRGISMPTIRRRPSG